MHTNDKNDTRVARATPEPLWTARYLRLNEVYRACDCLTDALEALQDGLAVAPTNPSLQAALQTTVNLMNQMPEISETLLGGYQYQDEAS